MRNLSTVSCALAAGLIGGCFGENPNESLLTSQLSGAIFTTLVDGTRVNANIYAAKTDVYLDGGPRGGGPASAAALPAGDYYFQVTDPSGKTLLSTDDISCRRIEVSGDGVIVRAYATATCGHLMGTDSDHPELGATTVQLAPYLDTPNPGGEYKVWVTPVVKYDADEGVHGFIHSHTKTDNFKVREIEVAPPPPEEECACCGDGIVEGTEQCDDGNTTSGDGCSATCQTETPPPPPEPCCGDNKVEGSEQCDDGNTTSGDGCSSTCTTELPPPPPPTEPCCGDNKLEGSEQCDDGNTTSGDGCSSTCTLEPLQ